MDLRFDVDSVSIRLSRDEGERLGVALLAGCGSMSRAEYYIVTGLAKPVVEQLAEVLMRSGPGSSSATVELGPGVEEIENPRFPRPPRPGPSPTSAEASDEQGPA
jgi:hypothetical protein